MKPRIKCFTWHDTCWFLFPDNVVARACGDGESYKSWQELYEWGQVPFVYF